MEFIVCFFGMDDLGVDELVEGQVFVGEFQLIGDFVELVW